MHSLPTYSISTYSPFKSDRSHWHDCTPSHHMYRTTHDTSHTTQPPPTPSHLPPSHHHLPTTLLRLNPSKNGPKSSFRTSTTQWSKLSILTLAFVSAITSENAMPKRLCPYPLLDNLVRISSSPSSSSSSEEESSSLSSSSSSDSASRSLAAFSTALAALASALDFCFSSLRLLLLSRLLFFLACFHVHATPNPSPNAHDNMRAPRFVERSQNKRHRWVCVFLVVVQC